MAQASAQDTDLLQRTDDLLANGTAVRWGGSNDNSTGELDSFGALRRCSAECDGHFQVLDRSAACTDGDEVLEDADRETCPVRQAMRPHDLCAVGG